MNASPGNERRTIIGLHYIRALATVLVVVEHAANIMSMSRGGPVLGGFFARPAGEIDLFFIMSGFIMMVSTHDADLNKPRLTIADFLRRRAVRILPLMWVAIVSHLLLRSLFGQSGVDLTEYVRAFALWPVGTVQPWPVWTIKYEIVFYLIFAVTFLAFPKWKFAFLLWASSPLLYYFISDKVDPDLSGYAGFLFSPVNIEFGIGVLIAFVTKRAAKYVIHVRFELAALVFALMLVRALKPDSLQETTLAYVAALAPICALLVAAGVLTEPRKPSKVVLFLGDASYSIFLFHPHALSLIFKVQQRLAPDLPVPLTLVAVTVLAVMATSLVHVAVERPLTSSLNRIIAGSRGRSAKPEAYAALASRREPGGVSG